MKLLSISTVETDDGNTYDVELYDISANVRVYKRRRSAALAVRSPMIYQQQRFGSAGFKRALKALVARAEPGSLIWEYLQCDCNLVREALAAPARPTPKDRHDSRSLTMNVVDRLNRIDIVASTQPEDIDMSRDYKGESQPEYDAKYRERNIAAHAEITANITQRQTRAIVIKHDQNADMSWLEQDDYNPRHPTYEPVYPTETDMKAKTNAYDGDWYRDPNNHVALCMIAYDRHDESMDSLGSIDFLANSDDWCTGTFYHLSQLDKMPYLRELAKEMGLPE